MSDHDAHQRSVDRNALTAVTFVEIVDTLVDDFDVIDVLDRSDIPQRRVVGGGGGRHPARRYRPDSLRVMAASTEQVELLELFQIQNDEGPCLDCFHTGAVVVHDNLDAASPWPQFAAEAVRAGFPSVCAVPLRLKDVILGCLNLFMSAPISLAAADVALAQALADVASIAIIQDQATREAAIREGQLQHALNSRIAIEQAKGMIAERGSVDMDAAFSILRRYRQEQQPRPHGSGRSPRERHAQDRRVESRPAPSTASASSCRPRRAPDARFEFPSISVTEPAVAERGAWVYGDSERNSCCQPRHSGLLVAPAS